MMARYRPRLYLHIRRWLRERCAVDPWLHLMGRGMASRWPKHGQAHDSYWQSGRRIAP